MCHDDENINLAWHPLTAPAKGFAAPGATDNPLSLLPGLGFRVLAGLRVGSNWAIKAFHPFLGA